MATEKVNLKFSQKQLEMLQNAIEAYLFGEEGLEDDWNTVDEMISLILAEVLEKKILSKVLLHKKEHRISLKKYEGIALQFALQKIDIFRFPGVQHLRFELPKFIV